MKTDTVVVTLRCNQSCGFCDRVRHASADPPIADIAAQIERAAARGVEALVLSGGEPLMRPDLGAIVRLARARAIRRVVLETNATLVPTPAAARALGVDEVVVSVVTSSPERHGELVSTTTSPRHVFRGIAAWLESGAQISIRLPVARGLPSPAARLAGLRHAFPKLTRFVLWPAAAGDAALAADQALAPDAVAAQIGEAYQEARRLGVALELAADRALPPCVVELPGPARRLLAGQLREEGTVPNAACDACASCALATRCTVRAEDIARFAAGSAPRPVAHATEYTRPGRSAGSRLRVLGAAEVETFFHVDYVYEKEVAEPTSRIGIIYRCNQVCTFCELADMDTELSKEKVRDAIEKAVARGSRRIIVTGGEPTLSPDLVDHVRYCRERGAHTVELQTNAVLLDKPGFAEALREAGLTSAQISLHGPDAAVSDRLTAAPGTHARTLRGIDRLLAVGVRCLFNHLVFKDNCHLLVEFVDMIEARWSGHRGQIVIQFHSPRNEFADREEGLRHVPRYTEYAATLRQAIDRARSLGYQVHDLQDPTGIPSLCVLGADESYLGPILDQTERPRFHAWESDWLTRVDACERCDASRACMGIPRHYLALHGDGEFVPIRLPARGPA